MADNDDVIDEQDDAPDGEQEEAKADGGKPKVDPSDLKARLGLKKKERRPPKVDHPAAADAPPEEADEAEVEAARKRAEEAAAEAGTAVESFSPLGQDPTPLPQALPDADALGRDDDGGRAKLPLGPMIVALVVVAVVGVFLGQVLGRSLQQRDLKSQYTEIVGEKLAYFRGAVTATGDPVLDRIAEMRESLRDMVAALDTVQSKGEDLATIEKSLTDMVAKMKRYRDEEVYIRPEALLDDLMAGIYGEDPLLEALAFATDTRHLYDVISASYDEATTLARIGNPPGATSRTIVLEEGEREIEIPVEAEEGGGEGEGGEGEGGEGDADPETEKATIPVGEAKWVKDTGRPAQVKLVDPKNPGLERTQWQMMVLRQGEDEPVQVPTLHVMSLDLTPIYAEHQRVVKELMLGRLEQIVRNAASLAATVRWKPVETTLQEWASK